MEGIFAGDKAQSSAVIEIAVNGSHIIYGTYRPPCSMDWLKKYTVDSSEFVIIDEYDEIISYDDFIDLVESKQKDEQCRKNPDNFSYCRNVDGYRFSDSEFC